MKKIIFPIIALSVLLVGCGNNSDKTEVSSIKTVKTTIVKSNTGDLTRTFPGIVKSSSITNLSFDISGRLIKLPIKEGQKLYKGQLIAQLEPDTQNYKLNSAEANYIEAQSDFNRYKQLYSQGVISASDYQVRKRKFETAKSGLSLAEKQLTNTILRAPFAGTVTKKIAENYQYVNGKETIAVLQDLNDLEVEINCPENLISYENQIDKMNFKAKFESYPDVEFSLKLKSHGKQADDVTKTFPVKFSVINKKDAIILPGMTSFVTIKFAIDEKSDIEVPSNAIFMDENGNKCVWVISKDNIATKSLIQTKELRGDNAIILSGIKNNDRVVVSGAYNILEGDKIKEYERLDLAK